MMQLSRDDVVATLGDIDDEWIAEILATGASARDLREALSELTTDTVDARVAESAPASPEVVALRAVLAELLSEPEAEPIES